jgi:hypothetical protein
MFAGIFEMDSGSLERRISTSLRRRSPLEVFRGLMVWALEKMLETDYSSQGDQKDTCRLVSTDFFSGRTNLSWQYKQ